MLKDISMDKCITIQFSKVFAGEHINEIKTYNQKEDNKTLY